MSDSTFSAPAPSASPTPSFGDEPRSDWFTIPALAGRLLWRHWPQLLFWFLLQWTLYGLAMKLSIWLGYRSLLLAYAGVAVLVVTQLACTIAMFLSLRPSLPNCDWIAIKRSGAAINGATALALALLPFVAYFAVWGLLDGIKRDFSMTYLNHTMMTDAEPIGDLLSIQGLWIALLVAVVVRHFARWLLAGNEGKLFRALVVGVCDAYWILVGITAIRVGVRRLRFEWTQTVAYDLLTGWWQSPFMFDLSLAPLKLVVDPVFAFLATAMMAMLPALVWLAITAVVFGIDLRHNQRIDHSHAHLVLAARRYRNAPYLIQAVAVAFSSGWARRIAPLINSIRLVMRAGLPALLTLCVGWQLLAFAESWSWRVLVELLGPRDWAEWSLLRAPVEMLFQAELDTRSGAIPTLLRIVLLAATLERALARLVRLSNARPPRRRRNAGAA